MFSCVLGLYKIGFSSRTCIMLQRVKEEYSTYNKKEEMLYPGVVPVENVSWMLLSEGGTKLEPRLGLGGDRLLTPVITHHAEYMGVLLHDSK